MRDTHSKLLKATMMKESDQATGIVHDAVVALAEDPKIPPDKRIQESTFLLAAVSYFVILAIAALILGGILWLYRTPETDEPGQVVPGIMVITTNGMMAITSAFTDLERSPVHGSRTQVI